jgi:predicted nucleic acid-binding protein
VALIARYLIDTSAAARMASPLVHARLAPLINAGLVATCATLDAEALYGARNMHEYEQIRADRSAAYEYLPTKDQHWQHALDAQHALAVTGQHRAVGIADLLTAVLGTEHQLTLIHYDADFTLAAEVLAVDHPQTTCPPRRNAGPPTVETRRRPSRRGRNRPALGRWQRRGATGRHPLGPSPESNDHWPCTRRCRAGRRTTRGPDR